uniref:Epoxide hydrolase n=1 Tax=Mylabris cichorii TaxID=580878 RepID=A0A1W5KJY8_MYLCI|nr:juvenile hormone epoxide hydrolase [Mylabris cichorii]
MSVVLFLVLVIILALVVEFLRQWWVKITEIPQIPKLKDVWWTDQDPAQEDSTIQPFKIHVPDEALEDLKNRLSNAKPLTHPLESIQHQYGINTKLLNEIIEFWRTKYNWREREAFLNKFPQYTVNVQGLRIHYLHVKPTETADLKVVPILLLHGWPGSIREFYELIPILTNPQPGRRFIFEVIAPSLPGFGFSQAATKPGLGAVQLAVVFKNFMQKLGFEKYYIQGGDWGAIIVQHMATLYPEHILGLHSNMCYATSFMITLKTLLFSLKPSWFLEDRFVKRLYPLKEYYANRLLETGYVHLQATKPDTIGVGLADSPIGLAAYILEKFITWTNPEYKNSFDGGLNEKFSYANLLDNVMIYWITNSITTSMRLYAETFSLKQKRLNVDKIPITIPAAYARFSHEIIYTPRCLLEEKFKKLLHESDYEGGHFAAFECPNILANDIYEAVARFERYYMYGY